MTFDQSQAVPGNERTEVRLDSLEHRIEVNKGYVYMQAFKLSKAFCVDKDDMVQEGMIGLVEAHRTYQDNRGASFLTWAAFRVRRRMVAFGIRNCFQVKVSRKYFRETRVNEVSINAPHTSGDDDDLKDRIPAPEHVQPDTNAMEEVRTQMAKLREKDRDVIEQHYLNGRTLTSMAEEEEITHQAMSVRLQYALDALRTKLREAAALKAL